MTTWSHPSDLDEWEREIIEREQGPGAFDDIAFVVYWRKYRDERGDAKWNGWPFTRGGMPEPYQVDDSQNEKNTWFLFPE